MAAEVPLADPGVQPGDGELLISLRIELGQFRNPEAYSRSAATPSGAGRAPAEAHGAR